MVCGWLLALAACGTDERAGKPAPTSPVALTPARTLAIVQAFYTGDKAKQDRLVAPKVIASSGESFGTAPIFGREALVATPNRSDCSLELVIAGAGEAVAIRHCRSEISIKRPPGTAAVVLRSIIELELAPDGLIHHIVRWVDLERWYVQVGVPLDADASLDIATGKLDTAAATGSAGEEHAEDLARSIVAALDRRETAALAPLVADGYTERSIHHAQPRVYATARDYVAALDDELAHCDASAYGVTSTFAAGAWVVVRFGKSCRAGARQAYTNQLWLMRFADGRLVEGHRATPRLDEKVQLGFDPTSINRKVRESGLL